MPWVSFDLFRTLGFTDTLQLKPEELFARRDDISSAEWVLFPPYWQLNALVYGLKARVFPSEASYRLGHNKIEMSRAFQIVAPVNTPLTKIVANTPENADMIWQEMLLPFVAKLPKSSMGDGVWLVEDLRAWREYLDKTDVLYVQEYLPITRDIRVVIVGHQVVSAYWRQQASRGFYNNVSKGGEVEYGDIPDAAIKLALHLARTLDIDHAGFDIAMVNDTPFVLEFNRLFGNQGIEGGGPALRESIMRYLHEQSQPTGPQFPTRPSSPQRRLKKAV